MIEGRRIGELRVELPCRGDELLDVRQAILSLLVVVVAVQVDKANRAFLADLRAALVALVAIVGVALNVGGLGVTSFGEQTIPSGVTALLIALLPIWVAVLGRVVYGDRIAVIDGGRVVESGTHDELSAQPEGLYRHLSSLQFGPTEAKSV
mgnify:CR=1 FL=1